MDLSPSRVERPQRVARDPWLISLLILWVLLLVHGWRSAVDHASSAPPAPALSTIDPNTAPWWELTVLPGIGEQRARAIVNFREGAAEAGRKPVFDAADDLRQVRGIGPRTVERIQPHLHFAESDGND